jgi:hypothetical protein
VEQQRQQDATFGVFGDILARSIGLDWVNRPPKARTSALPRAEEKDDEADQASEALKGVDAGPCIITLARAMATHKQKAAIRRGSRAGRQVEERMTA